MDAAVHVIDDILRPLIARDGGTLELVEVNSDRIVLRLGGACTGCPGRAFTERSVIEPLLRPIVGPDADIVVLRGRPMPPPKPPTSDSPPSDSPAPAAH